MQLSCLDLRLQAVGALCFYLKLAKGSSSPRSYLELFGLERELTQLTAFHFICHEESGMGIPTPLTSYSFGDLTQSTC